MFDFKYSSATTSSIRLTSHGIKPQDCETGRLLDTSLGDSFHLLK